MRILSRQADLRTDLGIDSISALISETCTVASRETRIEDGGMSFEGDLGGLRGGDFRVAVGLNVLRGVAPRKPILNILHFSVWIGLPHVHFTFASWIGLTFGLGPGFALLALGSAALVTLLRFWRLGFRANALAAFLFPLLALGEGVRAVAAFCPLDRGLSKAEACDVIGP